MQKSYQDAIFVPIRGPIGSLTNFGPLWALLFSSACFFAHSLTSMEVWLVPNLVEQTNFVLSRPWFVGLFYRQYKCISVFMKCNTGSFFDKLT